jgi:hypothetical protein
MLLAFIAPNNSYSMLAAFATRAVFMWRRLHADGGVPQTFQLCCAGGTGGASLSVCGSAVWMMDASGAWVQLEGLAGVRVSRAGWVACYCNTPHLVWVQVCFVIATGMVCDVLFNSCVVAAHMLSNCSSAGHRRGDQRHWLRDQRLQGRRAGTGCCQTLAAPLLQRMRLASPGITISTMLQVRCMDADVQGSTLTELPHGSSRAPSRRPLAGAFNRTRTT